MDRPTQPSTIQERATKPPGLLPKNVQSWLLLGLAFLMVAIMWLTGRKKPATAYNRASSVAPIEAPLEVNQAKIAEMQNRIQDLQRQQLLAETALAQETRQLSTPDHDAAAPSPGGADPSGGQHPPEDPIETERKRRAYVSLFSSNVALSYRKTSGSAQAPAGDVDLPPVPSAPPPVSASLPFRAIPLGLHENANATSRSSSAASAMDRKEETKNPAVAQAAAAQAAAGKTYVLFEGTILETVLINRLDGSFPGPVECLVSTDVYSNDRQHLLVPAGSKLLGETRKVDTLGQTRLAVLFHRMIMPDGYSVNLDGFKGLNQAGDTGLRDTVDNHYLRIFGVSLAIGALGAVAQGGTAGALTATGGDLMRQGFAQSTAQSSAQILDKFLNIMPTVTIREGHRVKVYLAGDLLLPDYLNHKINPDFERKDQVP
jgi:type IV secretion system protein TrbI